MKYRKEILATLAAVIKLGFKLTWADDGGEVFKLSPDDLTRAADVVLSVDESHVGFETPKGNKFWILFVLGNESGMAVADWSIPAATLDGAAFALADADEAKALDKALTAVSQKFEVDA